MFIRFYQILVIFLFPFILLFFLYRLYKDKEEPNRFFERFGYSKLSKSVSPVIWFHAASVGEFLSVKNLIKLISLLYPNHQILLTTTTKSSAKLVASSNNVPNFIHQMVPLDEYFSVRRFIKKWNPILTIFVESELWPNIIAQAASCGKVALVNARMTDKSYNKWKKYRLFFKEVINFFDYIDAQSAKDQQKISALANRKVSNSGNLKFNTQPLEINQVEIKKNKSQIANRPVLLVVSTHHNEEEKFAILHKQLLSMHPTLLTIIAPRHPERCKDIVYSLQKIGIKKVVRKSETHNIDMDTDIYIIDEIGVLGNYYDLTNIVFIGGSLVPIGGHNILEALKLEKVVIVGQYMDNFYEIIQDLLANKAIIQVKEESQLIKILNELLLNNELHKPYITNAKTMLNNNKHTTEKILHNIVKLIDK